MAAGDLVFNHITSFLKFEDDPKKKNIFALAIRDHLSDLNFVYADFLLHYIKLEYPVILVNLTQSFHHYSQIMLKVGINLKLLRESKKIISIDVLSEAESAINDSGFDIQNASNLSSIISDSSSNDCLDPLFDSIKKAIEAAVESKPKQFLLLIDEINVFINLGVSFSALQQFIQKCHSFCTRVIKIPGMLLVGLMLDENDEESMKQVKYLSHNCELELQVEGLKTGYSKNIQGKITCRTRNISNNEEEINQKFYFKVQDKGSKFFADGL